jgi:hypothetical protein
MALVFGITIIGCDDGSTSGGGDDSALNGTWVRVSMTGLPEGDGYEITLNNGNSEGRFSDGNRNNKGWYTTNNGTMTTKTTHVWGSMYSLEAKWYTQVELQSAFASDPIYSSLNIENWFIENIWTYSINGKTFTRTRADSNSPDGSHTQTWTKK